MYHVMSRENGQEGILLDDVGRQDHPRSAQYMRAHEKRTRIISSLKYERF